ncbi:hypothetical protein DUNSADRAFT_15024 [Dunaliella salina]|uniref:Uncharacterized protein n=1 Tax=Dunaliella salina TaxID=3046 RepID=A0ABQ7G674_DUNSA|nr:hypothetical protein DUNSADRAFT_15024 [Dunaliella salina]|eukprot:KAF5830107.1 hypothetical protein DUNSADRAFT_15024 [Dunaliella salina]
MLLSSASGQSPDLGADCYFNSPFVRQPAKHAIPHVDEGPLATHEKRRPHRRSISVEFGLSKRPHRNCTQPHLLHSSRDPSKCGSGPPSSSTTFTSVSGSNLFTVLSSLHTPPKASGSSFSTGQCAPKTRQKSLIEVMQATNKALSHFTPSDSECPFSPSPGSGLGSGDISPSPPLSPKMLPTRPNFGKHSLGSCNHPPEAQRSFHISRGNSRLKMGVPGSSTHSSEGGQDVGSEDEAGSVEAVEPGWGADCPEGGRQMGLYSNERVEAERPIRKLEQGVGDAGREDKKREGSMQGVGQIGDSVDSISGLARSTCNPQVLKQSSFQNRGPRQHLRTSSALGMEDLLHGNAKTIQANPIHADSDGLMGPCSSSRLPAGHSAPQIDLRAKAESEKLHVHVSTEPEDLNSLGSTKQLHNSSDNQAPLHSMSLSSAPRGPQPPPSLEKSSTIHGPPRSSSTWNYDSSGSASSSRGSTNKPLTSKLARMFSGLSNSLTMRMSELTKGADASSRSKAEGSSSKGGQEGLRGCLVSTEGVEDVSREGVVEEHRAEGLYPPAPGPQHVPPRRSLSCSTLPPLASKASLTTTSTTVPSSKGPPLSQAVNSAQSAAPFTASVFLQQPPAPSPQTTPAFPVPCPPSEGPPSTGSLRSHLSLPQGQSGGRPRLRPSSSIGVAAAAASHSNPNSDVRSLPLPTSLSQQHLCTAGTAPQPTFPLSTDNLHQLSVQQQQQQQQHKMPQQRNTTVGPLGCHSSVSPGNGRPLLLSTPLSSSSLRPSSGLHGHSGPLLRTGPKSTDALNASMVSNTHASPQPPSSLMPAPGKASKYVGGAPQVNTNMLQTNGLVNSNLKGELAGGSPLCGSPPSSYPWVKGDSRQPLLRHGASQGSSPPVPSSFLNPVASELLRTRLSERDAERVLRRHPQLAFKRKKTTQAVKALPTGLQVH